MSKWVGNTTHILSYLFDSASTQHHKVWASQFPFHHSIKDFIPPTEACLYGCINWYLAQAHHKSSIGLSQYSISMRGPRTMTSVLCSETTCAGASLPKKSHLDPKSHGCHGGRKSMAGELTSTSDSLTLGRKGVMGTIIPNVSQSSRSSCIVQVRTLPKFLDPWRNITSDRFVFIVVKGYHLQLRGQPLLFHNFRQFIIKANPAHHSIIQKEVDKLLVKGAILITICTYLLLTYLLSQMCCFLLNENIILFSIDLKEVYLHIPIVKHHYHVLQFVWPHKPYEWKVLPFWLVMAPRVFTSLTNL